MSNITEVKKGQSGSGSASEETILSQPQDYAQSLSRYEYEDLEDIYSEYKVGIENGKWEVSESVFSKEESLLQAYKSVFRSGIGQSDFNEHQRMVILAEDITSRTESNARYLLEQGLNVQCIEVNRFEFAPEMQQERDYSLLTSSTVVDYPFSRVRPSKTTADFSNLTGTIRDRLVHRVGDVEGIEEVQATPTQVRAISAYPPGLHYQVYIPGNMGGRQANVRINASRVSQDYVDELRLLLTSLEDRPQPYRVAEEGVMNLVYRNPQIPIDRDGGDAIETTTDEITALIKWVQADLVEMFSSSN